MPRHSAGILWIQQTVLLDETATTTDLYLDPEHTTLATVTANTVVLDVGVRRIVDALFRHDPPVALEIERAIDTIEDALMRSRLQHAERGDLVTHEPLVKAWFPVDGAPDVDRRLSRDEVEAVFERLAAASMGQSGALAGLPTGRDAAAALLILRECMHHLGFDGIQFLTSTG